MAEWLWEGLCWFAGGSSWVFLGLSRCWTSLLFSPLLSYPAARHTLMWASSQTTVATRSLSTLEPSSPGAILLISSVCGTPYWPKPFLIEGLEPSYVRRPLDKLEKGGGGSQKQERRKSSEEVGCLG
ncbi:hypothetical protein M430DRAFT_31882 [Amorphotheca resinae ATCC 22711]|uniref:Uncharacterized protein n=1 Tax=Amorphotheca resinae ATCC 22711 TaxID=857342 RepID=A0A2T3APF3_AMORE|nr:hypothetical protein M430DRAFT_31882 [Amorphotheca resinae ATCC 22711]PSS06780.1 hypothetical protein M430DRAFT_31882 [Amorphotheca resinae ATCC 22711]